VSTGQEVAVIVSNQSQPLRLLLTATVLCAGLAGALVLELTSASNADAPASGAAAASSPPSVAIPKTPNRFTLPPVGSFAEIAERPLFSSSRRPAAVDAPQSAEQPFSATLAGIVISASSSSIIVSHGDPAALTRLKQGDNLDGWSITSIEPNRVLLRRDGEERQLKLRDVPGQAVAAAPKIEPASRPRH
jgi:general secretion pathway protein N